VCGGAACCEHPFYSSGSNRNRYLRIGQAIAASNVSISKRADNIDRSQCPICRDKAKLRKPGDWGCA
jgi:hypothetical protein